MVMIEIENIVKVDNKYVVNFIAQEVNSKILKKVCDEVFNKYKLYTGCNRSLIKCCILNNIPKTKSLNEYIVSIKTTPLKFTDICGVDYNDMNTEYYFLYDGEIKYRLTPSYYNPYLITFKFYDIDKFGLKELIIDEFENMNGVLILGYIGVNFETEEVLYEISDKIYNPLFDIIIYNGKIINDKLYKWFVDDNTEVYNKIRKIHNDYISFIEWLCSEYINENIYEFINNQYFITDKFNLIAIYKLIIDANMFDIYYNNNDIISNYDLDYVLNELNRLKIVISECSISKENENPDTSMIEIPRETYEELKYKAELLDKIKDLIK